VTSKRSNKIFTALSLSFTLIIAACGSENNSDDFTLPVLLPSESDQPDNMDLNVDSYGIISLRIEPDEIPFQREFHIQAGAFATSSQLNQDVTIDEVRSIFTLLPDSCSVFVRDSDALSIENPSIRRYQSFQNPSIAGTSIGAGSTIVISSEQSTLLESIRRRSGNVIYYENDVDISNFLLPSELVVDVPGSSSFPSTSVLIGTVERPILTSPSRNEITKFDTVFEWQVEDDTSTVDSFIRLSAFKNVGSSRVFVDCYATDDGSFMFPDSVFETIGAGELNDYSFALSRGAIGEINQDGAYLLVLYYVGRGNDI